MTRNSLRELRLAAGDATVDIAPAIGGAITAFRWRNHDVLRPTPAAALVAGDVRSCASYPLVPYSNRVRDATLVLRDGTHRLAHNFGDHPHSIHGIGWQRVWTVEALESSHVRLALEHVPTGDGALAWPFGFRAEQALILTSFRDAAVLTLTLTLRNEGALAFPFGLGWHPFFPRDPLTQIGFRADGVWETDATRLPTTHVPLSSPTRFHPPRAIGTTTLDNVFTGWRGRAQIRWPQAGLRAVVEADTSCSHLVVFIPAERDFAAVEPVTHMTDAFNREARGERDTGTLHLRPEQAHSCTMRIVATTCDRHDSSQHR